MTAPSIREDLLKRQLKLQIEKTYSHMDFKKYHDNTKNGFYNSLVNIVIQGTENHKYDKYANLRGYHVHSKLIHNFERNKIVQDIGIKNLICRADWSTYHANNSRGKSNGYPHWYVFKESVNEANNIANFLFNKEIEHNKKYENTNEKYKDIIRNILTKGAKSKDKSTMNYIKIDKQNFICEYKRFTMGLSTQFSIVLNRVFYWDQDFVYVDNSPYNEVYNEPLDGYGRSYTLIGLLSKGLRKRLLEGHFEIDIETTAQTIYLNLYYMNTIKGGINTDLKQWRIDFPEHHELIRNKLVYRCRIASLFKVDIQTAKKIITHITYSPDSNVIHTYAKDKSPAIKAKIKIGLKKFLLEAKKLREAILEKFYHQEKDHNPHLRIGNLKLKEFKPLIDEEIRINNLKLKGKGRGKKLDDRIAFRINELVEHQIREKMITFIEDFVQDKIYQIHDALIFKVARNGLNTNLIEDYIKQELGFNIKISTETL